MGRVMVWSSSSGTWPSVWVTIEISMSDLPRVKGVGDKLPARGVGCESPEQVMRGAITPGHLSQAVQTVAGSTIDRAGINGANRAKWRVLNVSRCVTA